MTSGGTSFDSNQGQTGKPSVLLAAGTCDDLHLLLGRAGFDVHVAWDGEAALEWCRRRLPDVVIIDFHVPRLGGLEICRQLRGDARTGDVAVVVVSDETAEPKKVVAFETGADDYVTRPFGARELVARLHAILRRSRRSSARCQHEIRHADLAVDIVRHEVTYQGNPVNLTATEFQIVRLLLSEPGRVFTRRQIGARIRDGFAEAADRTIDSHVKSIRRKLGAGAAEIQTVRGMGYRLRSPARPPASRDDAAAADDPADLCDAR
jgi:DNA-binding response OmpR family regulator